jgi:hypothetical protein
MAKWVCHISGQGAKWEVFEEGLGENDPYWDHIWTIHQPHRATLVLPKSEYKECEGPEEWERVQTEVNPHNDGQSLLIAQWQIGWLPKDHRWKEENGSFIIERRKM